MSRHWQRVCTVSLLIGLLSVGAVLRLTGINWDQLQHVHPDERFIVWVADSISLPPDLSSALDPERSTIDPFRWPPGHGDEAGRPRAFAYGHFPLYLLVLVAHGAQAIGRWFGETTLAFPAAFQPLHVIGQHLAEYNYLALVGRAISALCDLGVLALVFGLGRRIYGLAAGLLAAGAYAFAVLPIQLSHFYAVDMVLTFCVVMTVALAVEAVFRQAQGDRLAYLAWPAAGVCAGLAVGSKFSAILLGLPLLVAAGYRAVETSRATQRVETVAIAKRAASLLVVAGGAAILTFVATNPFAVIEFPAYLSNILAQNAMVSGAMDAPYTRQYIGTLPYLYFVQQLSQWGTGWPLGLVAWGGLVWGLIRLGLRRTSPAEAVILAWALPYFALTGAFHAKFLRYMAPLLPFLLIFAAGAALSALRWLRARWQPPRLSAATKGASGGRPAETSSADEIRPAGQRRGEIAWGIGAVFVAATTIFWAIAFVGVYRQEHPWIQASRWIYANIPDGSRLLTEHWDDALPLLMDGVSGRPASRTYAREELPLYDPDTPAKLGMLADVLSDADYLIVASNRLSAPLSRLRERYPMTSHYYELLSEGQLGYTLVAEFHAYPQALGITIPDDHADESFTVYDHPRALIYRNTARLSSESIRTRLGRYLPVTPIGRGRTPGHAEYLPLTLSAATKGASGGRPAETSSADEIRPAGLPPEPPAPGAPLTLGQPVDTLPVVADFRWNRLASETPLAAIVCWWLALSLLGWAAWPLLFPLMGGLRDRGFALSRTAAWLLVGWVHWMAVSLGLWQNRTAPIAAVCGALVLAGVSLWRVQRREIAAFWAARRRLLLGEEALFGLAFLAFVAIRILNPDLWQPWNGGEKFMESAFLNATLRSAHFPPYDPYFAGGTLNYYYYGLYLVSLLIKLTGIAPEVAFNLAVPVLFALTALAIFSIAYSLTARPQPQSQLGGGRPLVSGLLAVVLALLMGNLDALKQFVGQVKQLAARLPAPGFDYWASSRVIPETINEFPFWSFLFADLHPHLIAMPFGMLVVGFAANWVLGAGGRGLEAGSSKPEDGGRAFLAAVVTCLLLILSLGALGAINTWDFPTYFLLVAGGFLAAGWRRARGGGSRGLLGGAGLAAGVGAAAVVAYLPFYLHYALSASQAGGANGALAARYLGTLHAASPLEPWLTVWGIFIFLSIGAVAWLWRSSSVSSIQLPASGRLRTGLIAVLGLSGILAGLVVAERPTAAIMVVPLALALPVVFRRSATPEQNVVALLLALGAAVVAGTELIYVRDFLEGGDWYRMNTLFKFSVPAWLFFGLACGVSAPHLWDGLARLPAWTRQLWRAAAAALILAGLLFLPLGAQARVSDRFPEARPPIGTLNGMDYMTAGILYWPDEGHRIDLAYDYLAIQWLLDHVTGTPVVAEAPAGNYTVEGQPAAADYYRAGGLRAASFTGFPTLVGQHQYEQRPGEQVSLQLALGKEFFTTTDLARTRDLARELRIRYVYVGQLERILFAPDSLRKFDAMTEQGELEVAYRNLRTTIYRVK